MQIPDQTPGQQPVCLRCGRCCRYGRSINASSEDLVRWIREDRSDILRYFEAFCSDDSYVNCGRIPGAEFLSRVLWTDMINPDSGDYYTDCPFLVSSDEDTWFCQIHETRPAICVRFRPWEWGEKGRFFACPLVDRRDRGESDGIRPEPGHSKKDDGADQTDQP